MGVDIYLLGRGRVTLEISGILKKVGILNRLCKVTELNQCRVNEMDVCHEAVQGKPAPVAVLAWSAGVFPVDASNKRVDARAVLAWEPNRSAVCDRNVECLPVLGYALMDQNSGRYVLHEQRKGLVLPVSLETAKDKNLLDKRGNLVRKSAPRIVRCEAVEVKKNYRIAVANCVLETGTVYDICTNIESEHVPEARWYIGKKPSEVQVFYGA